jgi:predicted DNA-binding transcriptional regulator YafY
VGQRGQFESACGILQAFVSNRRWTQADLSRSVGISSQSLRKVLNSLLDGGMPLTRLDEPPQVYWEVPKGWLPGALAVTPDELPVLVEALLGLSQGKHRDALLRKLLQGHPKEYSTLGASVEQASQFAEESIRTALLQAAAQRHAVRVRYFTSSKGVDGFRTLSVQRLVPSPRPRVVAYCHRAKELRWFRVDQFLQVDATPEAFVVHDSAEVEQLLKGSVDGFHEPTLTALSFRVRYPSANWVKHNLPPGMKLDEEASTSDSVRVVASGGALIVARFITSLGGLAIAEGEALTELVRETAEGTLEAHAASSRKQTRQG